MSEGNYGHPGNESSGRARDDRDDRQNRPLWKRVQHHWGFWVGMVFMFAAITMYVMSDDLSLIPRGRRPAEGRSVGRTGGGPGE